MKIDKSNMRQVILDFPKQFRIGLKAAENVKVSNFEFRASNLIVCGMGGSALPADILSIWLRAHKISLPLYIHRDYGLPYHADERHFIVCISYSGNTEETLSAFDEAKKRKLSIAVVTSGGKLAKLCKMHGVPTAIIPSGLASRMALGFQFSALMKILANSGLIGNNLEEISDLENSLKPRASENQGKKMAKNLSNKIPLIYASGKLKALARIWKIKFNENAKIPAFSNYFPELNHNEHGQFEGNKNNQLAVIILRDPADHPRIIKRMKLLSEMLSPKKVQVNFIDIDGKDVLYKIFDNILLSDWISYYLALEYKTNPTPVRFNDEFKKSLGQMR